MGWESPGGTTHYTPPNFQYDTCYPMGNTPPNGSTEGVVPPPPPPPQCGTNGRDGQQAVHFHVKAGEAVSLQLGGQVQTIQGPATVRWVSMNHEPPLSLPVQAPPGHFVQQILDENGVLTHFILSEHPSFPPAPPYPNSNQNGVGWNNQFYVGDMNGTVPPGPPPQPNNFQQQNLYQDQQRPLKTQNHKRKYRDPCGKGKSGGSLSPSLSTQSTPPQSPVKPRGSAYMARPRRATSAAVDDSEESGIGIEHDEDQEEKELYIEILSNIRTPKVPEINDTWALLVWTPPFSEPGDQKFENIKPIATTDLEYEVLISDKGKDGKYRSIYNGTSLDCYLTDLRPNTEYHVRVHATLKSRNIKGGASDTVSFVTKCCVPDQPQPPKLTQRSKTSLHLRWNGPNDNGRHILHYILEYDEGSGQVGHYVPVYEGRAKQCNVSRLQPSTLYKFRVAAVSELGSSLYSEIISYATQGSPPSQPLPPTLAETSESSLRLLWSKRPCDDEFTLQMEDAKTGHGFLSQYNGPEVEYTVLNLRKNTTYRFKLRAHNEMGASAYSSDVSYTTNPGRPGPPPKPQVMGRVRSTSFRVRWNKPADDGGSQITEYELETDNGEGWQSVYRGGELEFSCDQLQPGTTYRVRVAAKSTGGVSDYSESCFVTTEPVVPGPPSPPVLRDQPKAMSLHLTWTPPADDGGATVTEFEIDMTSPDNTTRGVYRGRETECVVASLLPGRPYLFQVRAYNRAGSGAWSPPLQVLSGAGPPDKPREPKAVCRSGSLVNVSWDQPINNGADITGYRLEMAQVSAPPAVVESDTEDEEEEDDEEEDEVEDEVEVEEVYEDESEEEQEPEPEVKEQLKPCDTKEEVVYEPELLSELVWRQVYAGPDRSTDVKELLPATQYQLRVSANNSAGCSPYSCTVSLETPCTTPAQPHTLVPLDQSADSISFKWKKPADNGDRISGYHVEWTGPDKETKSTLAEGRKILLDGLRPDTTFSIRVQAVNSKGKGQLSAALKMSTKPLPPAPPRLECLSVLHNSLKLKWADGKTNLGTNYILETENSKKVWYPVYNGSAHSFKHSRLVENTDYRYRICAATEAGQGPFSGVSSFKTTYAPPPPVKVAPRVSAITESGCLLQWTPQRGSSEQLHYKVLVTRPREDKTTTFMAAADSQLRIGSLEPRGEYTVRVVTIRNPPGQASILGTPSPATSFTTLAKAGPVSTAPVAVAETHTAVDRRDAAWSDQKWAAVILSGFALFAVFVAMLIQQLISLGTVSS